MLKTNEYTVYTLVLDNFKLDGGSMFGVVPKVLWEKQIPSDEKNRIPLCGRALVLESADRKILVDLGCGTKWDEKGAGNFDIRKQYPGRLQEVLSGVTDVVLSHLHFDHCGGVSFYEGETLKLTFPDARHYVSEENYRTACNPGAREKGSYLENNVSILAQADLKLLKEGDTIADQISVSLVHGHTQGMMMVSLEEDKVPRLVFVSDLIPTQYHVPLPYIMGYDMHAALTLEERSKWYDLWCKNETILVFPHDRDCAACILGYKNGRYYPKEMIALDRSF
jgi:glyoxylase-like metal-dependent hydrolase (beta-lactamase superfamily II)